MASYAAPPDSGGAEGCLDDEASSCSPASHDQRSILDEAAPPWVFLKRAERRMVLFRGWPDEGLILAFEELDIAIGLAIQSDDLAKPRSLQSCSYAFIGTGLHKRSPFTAALHDLIHAGWSIDPDARWPVIDGSLVLHGVTDADQRRRPTSPRQQKERSKQTTIERVEA